MQDLRQMGIENVEPHVQFAWRNADVHTVWHRMPRQIQYEAAYVSEAQAATRGTQVFGLWQTEYESDEIPGMHINISFTLYFYRI